MTGIVSACFEDDEIRLPEWDKYCLLKNNPMQSRNTVSEYRIMPVSFTATQPLALVSVPDVLEASR